MEKRILDELLLRGFNEKTLLNNRGLIGATIDSVDKIKELDIRKERNIIWNLIADKKESEDDAVNLEIDIDILYKIIFNKL